MTFQHLLQVVNTNIYRDTHRNMYMNGKFTPQIKYTSRSYVVLCYAKTKRGWITADDYRNFQLNRESFIKDISRNFERLSKCGYLAKHKDGKVTRFRITADGEMCLRRLGQQRKADYEDMLRENGNAQILNRNRNKDV